MLFEICAWKESGFSYMSGMFSFRITLLSVSEHMDQFFCHLSTIHTLIESLSWGSYLFREPLFSVSIFGSRPNMITCPLVFLSKLPVDRLIWCRFQYSLKAWLSFFVACRLESRPAVHGADPQDNEANRRTRQWSALWPAVEWSWQRNHGMGWERQRRELYLWLRGRRQIPS